MCPLFCGRGHEGSFQRERESEIMGSVSKQKFRSRRNKQNERKDKYSYHNTFFCGQGEGDKTLFVKSRVRISFPFLMFSTVRGKKVNLAHLKTTDKEEREGGGKRCFYDTSWIILLLFLPNCPPFPSLPHFLEGKHMAIKNSARYSNTLLPLSFQ